MNTNALLNGGNPTILSIDTPKNLEPIGTFFAKSSLREKLGKVCNNILFGIVIIQLTLKIAKGIPKIKDIVKEFEKNILNHSVISTLIKYKIHWIPSVLVARKILAVLVGYLVYPATLMTFRKDLNPARNEMIKHFEGIGYKIQSVTLNKSGINYSAFLLGPKENLANGNWVQVAGGNCWVGEYALQSIAQMFKGKNILYINGPSVGRSTGFPTTYAMGAAQEAGLQLLEKMNAKKILLYGTSLGGGAQAVGNCAHKFKKGVEYLVWSDRSFSKLSDAASAMVTSILKVVFPVLGVQLDGVAGARRLNKLGIPQIITNAYYVGENTKGVVLPRTGDIIMKGTDGVIPNKASLYVGVRKILNSLPRPDLISFFGNSDVSHNGPLTGSLNNHVFQVVEEFFN